MNKKLKIALLGGGSLYFESVIKEIAMTPELAGSEIMLFDPDARRMEIMRQVGVRIAALTSSGLAVRSTNQCVRALDGADFAVASIGVHGPGHRWHKADSDAVAKFGIIQTTGDTVGPSGLSQALRIIPIFADIARKMEKYCPDAILLNHSNPMSPICRAVAKYSKIRAIGYCHNVAGGIRYFAEALGVDGRELDVTAAGPNHCVWLLGIRHRGRDMYPVLRRRLAARPSPARQQFSDEVFNLFGLYPIGGDRHIIEFFPHARRASKTKNIPYGLQWRSDMIRANALAAELSKEPRAIELKAAGKKPIELPKENSPEAMGRQIKALAFGPDMVHYVNVPNRGAVSNLPDWAVVELKAVVGQGGAQPMQVGELPAAAARWSAAQLYAHELTVEAAVEGSRAKALMALACDPMIRDFHEARAIFDALIKVQAGRLDRFRK